MKLRISFVGLWQAIAGISLALILQTNSRFAEGLGFGELGLAACATTGLLFAIMSKGARREHGEPFYFAIVLSAYLMCLLVPLTTINSYFETPGSSPRDLLAYGLGFGFVLALATAGIRVEPIARWLIGACLLLVIYQYLFGGSNAWYSIRFTGGAKNPNQLALYLVCCIFLALGAVKRKFLIWAAVGTLLFFALKTMSDAFIAFLMAAGGAMLASLLVPRRYFVPLLVPMAFGFAAAMTLVWPLFTEWMLEEWYRADEGGGRVVLYVNGLRAWVSSFDSIIIGNGAGGFSGLFGPFQGAEAHNTPIDVLTIGGLTGLVVFFVFPVRNVVRLYVGGNNMLFAAFVGVVCFSFFHFVARHPVWWFTLYAAICFAARSPVRTKSAF